MIIYFLRHADAEDLAESDFDRKLTPKGLDQAARVGKFCKKNGIKPEVFLTSPLVRARQTAEIVGKKIGVTPVIADWLACGMTPATLIQNLEPLSTKSSALLVGHEPDLSTAVSYLLGLTEPVNFPIRKASLTAIDAPWLDQGSGALEFSIPPKLL
ncbi:MAG: phosphohistidine phosphatase SixA [Terrimicrobiaceae bacterium]